MKSFVSHQLSVIISRKIAFCLLLVAYYLLTSCSQPILESENCIASRDVVKKLYSFHIGNDMKPSEENLEKRKRFLSKELIKNLSESQEEKKDYFTQTDDYPKAFRAGKCEDVGKDKTKFEILLFWRTNNQNIQREIEVETIKEDNEWKINSVSPKN